MSYGKYLNKFSSLFFFLGFATAKLQLLPFYFFSFITSIFSLACYLTGYLLWLVASFINPHSDKHSGFWYGFTSFTTQHKVAATLGAAAIICFFIALTSPFVAIPAVWLYAAGNTFWCIAEYHKWKHPPQDQEYSAKRQANYLQYALLTTATSFVTALSITFSMIFPLSGFAILTSAAIISLIFSIQSLNAWASVNLSKDKPDCPLTESYLQMVENLNIAKSEIAQAPKQEKTSSEKSTPHKPLFIDEACLYLTNISANEINIQIEPSTTYSLN
ncbi:Uncharacterised protein [Legionella busanensis]|uniref:Transmembrane protein n=1 Tax=Legionella busanensis TaxID=190655 RepID=A0A378JMW1_9GAMM|nr:hypothetical protein [Legionella busanensis]STX51529.1 Uncharacterised protein [Legionella busanensis]